MRMSVAAIHQSQKVEATRNDEVHYCITVWRAPSENKAVMFGLFAYNSFDRQVVYNVDCNASLETEKDGRERWDEQRRIDAT